MMRTLTPVLSLVIAILLFFFFTKPALTEISTLQGRIDEYKNAAEQYTEFSRLLEEKLSVKRNRSAYENERLDLLIPDQVDETRLLVDLEAMAETHNMLFGNVSVEGGKKELSKRDAPESSEATTNELATVDIVFEVIGTYEQFKELLRDIEESIMILEVVELSFDASEGNFQQFSVTVRAFALPDNV